VDHWTFWLDLKILLMTVGKVLKRDSINTASGEIMPEFMGSQDKIHR
jgi:hypothetical protein